MAWLLVPVIGVLATSSIAVTAVSLRYPRLWPVARPVLVTAALLIGPIGWMLWQGRQIFDSSETVSDLIQAALLSVLLGLLHVGLFVTFFVLAILEVSGKRNDVDELTSSSTRPPRRILRWMAPLLFAVALLLFGAWMCWPGRISYFNIWLVRPGMSLERVEWILGSPDEELSERTVPATPGGGKVVSGERFYKWRDGPSSFWRRYLIVSFEGGVVKEIHFWEWEEPLS